MKCRLLLCLLAVLTATALSDPHQVRRWTGKNGKSFNGAYMGVDKASGKYEFALDNGKTCLIDPNNISEEDIEWLEGELNPSSRPNPSVGDPIDFLPDPDMDRTLLPVIDQSDYGSKASDCVPSSFCNFLLWWDDRRYLPIDKKGDFEKKAEYIHSKVARYFRTRNNAGTRMTHATEGVEKYFERELGDLATCRIRNIHDISVENLRRYTVGANATLLNVTTYYGRREQSGHVVALSHIDEKGDLIMHTWGTRIRGRLSEIKQDGVMRRGALHFTAPKYAIELMNKADFPEWMIENEVSFQIDPQNRDGLTVIAPYRYKEPGKKSPPPPDPIMVPAMSRRDRALANTVAELRNARKPLQPPSLPHRFQTPISYSREWTFSDGTVLDGRVTTCDQDTITIHAGRELDARKVEDLTKADQARALLWRGISGEHPELTFATMEYVLSRAPDFESRAIIQISGSHFRLEVPTAKRTIIGNVKTGAFIVYWSKEHNHIGRLAPEQFVPQPPKGEDLGAWEKFRDATPLAVAGTHPQWPCRRTSWLDPVEDHVKTFRKPVTEFSSVTASRAFWTALGTFLDPTAATLKGGPEHARFLIFSGVHLAANHPGAREFFGACQQSRLFPIRLQWTNVYRPDSPNAKWDKLQAGRFLLELKTLDLTRPPDGLFNIPEETTTVPVGFYRKVPADNRTPTNK